MVETMQGTGRFTGPLDTLDLGGAHDAVTLCATGRRDLLNLRCRPGDRDTVAAVERELGLPLPLAPNRCNGHGEQLAAWLGPDEWLLFTADGAAADLECRLRTAAGDDPWLSLTDVSHSYTGLRLAGPAARNVLAKGCPLDLHPRAFRAGDCAQTVLAGTRMLLRCLDDDASMELSVRNSFARYAAHWLIDAMAEYRA